MNTLDLFRLDGKTALVTGCKRGIGKAMALALAEAGADILGVSASLEASGSDIEQEVTALAAPSGAIAATSRTGLRSMLSSARCSTAPAPGGCASCAPPACCTM